MLGMTTGWRRTSARMLRGRGPRLPKQADPALAAELTAEPPWMYPWQITRDLRAPLLNEELRSIHQTREEMIEPVVRAALGPGSNPRALDIACHEGWFAHRLMAWGAEEVVAIDIRDINVRRATMLRDHYGISPSRLSIEQGSVYDLASDRLGRFDVVLVLGLIYHLENPIGALRVARSLTRGLCVVESQLTQQSEPIRHGWGIADQFEHEPASWAARREPDHEQANQPLAAHGGVVSLIPNRAALLQAMSASGFTDVQVLRPSDHHNPQYRAGDRVVVTGRA
jgi:tRNA (mo5U34)-methyltransferase